MNARPWTNGEKRQVPVEKIRNKKQCIIWFFLFTLMEMTLEWFTFFNKMEPSQLPFNGKYNLPRLNLDISTKWIFTQSLKYWSTWYHIIFFLPYNKVLAASVLCFLFFSFFWCLEKLWCCVCLRTWWDIWGTQCHFMGGGSGESTDFLSGSFSVFCNNWLTNLEHNLKREWYGRYFPNGEFNRPLNPNWEIRL